MDYKKIGDIGNYYGCLNVKESEGKYYWSIENFDGHYWEPISETLYKELLKHDKGPNTPTPLKTVGVCDARNV